MKQNFKKKVCLIVDSLSVGGAERAAAALSVALANSNYHISIISLRNEISYDYKGTLYNLGVNEVNFKLKKQFYKFLYFLKAYRSIDADVYIDFRMRNRFLMECSLHLFVFSISKMIMGIRSYNVFYHMPQSKLFYREYAKSKAIQGVSLLTCERLSKIYDFKNLISIPNFYSNEILESVKTTKNYLNDNVFVLGIGRLNNEVKQFDRLILAYKDSLLFTHNIPLFIIGEGKDRSKLEVLIKEHDLNNYVKLLGFKEDVYAYLKAAKFLMLSSKVEGFPNVILEALALETPVISFDCKSGPSEVIIDGENGILVENQNFQAFQGAIDKMIKDRRFYEQCKANARSSISKFSQKEVLKKWIELIEN